MLIRTREIYMASIKEIQDKNGKYRYYVQIRLKGYPPQHASFKRKTDAERWIQQTEAAMREGRHFKTSAAKKHTFGELIDRYVRDVLPKKKKSEQRQGTQLKWWKERLSAYLLADITPALISEQRDFLLRGITKQGKVRSPATVVRYMAALSHVYTIAIKEWGWIEDSPISKVIKPKEPRGRIRFLSDEERPRLLQACEESRNPYLYLIVVLALSTGMRQGEILNLKWSQVELDNEKGRITLYETKNHEIRPVALASHAFELMRQFRTAKIGDRNMKNPEIHGRSTAKRDERSSPQLLFPGTSEKKPIDIRSAWEAALKKAGISDFKFHDLRHSCASYLAMDGASAPEIAAVLGHKTLAMVKRYAHLSDPHTAGVISRMNQKIFGR